MPFYKDNRYSFHLCLYRKQRKQQNVVQFYSCISYLPPNTLPHPSLSMTCPGLIFLCPSTRKTLKKKKKIPPPPSRLLQDTSSLTWRQKLYSKESLHPLTPSIFTSLKVLNQIVPNILSLTPSFDLYTVLTDPGYPEPSSCLLLCPIEVPLQFL